MGWPLPEARLRVDFRHLSSLFVLGVETVGEAWQLGWHITALCAWGDVASVFHNIGWANWCASLTIIRSSLAGPIFL